MVTTTVNTLDTAREASKPLLEHSIKVFAPFAWNPKPRAGA